MNILLKYLSEIHVDGAMYFREIYRYEYFTAMVMQKIEQKNHFSFRNVHVLRKHQSQENHFSFDDALLKAPIDLSIKDSIRKEPQEMIHTVFCFTYGVSSYCLAIKKNEESAGYEKYKVYIISCGTENNSAPVSSSQDNADQLLDDLLNEHSDPSLVDFN